MVVNNSEMNLSSLRIGLFEAVILSFCAFVVKLSAGTECSPDECKIEQISSPEYVTAFYEHHPALSGCMSRERSSTNEEVHVVVVRGLSSASNGQVSGVSNRVDVMIKRTSQYTGLEKPVFVLVSARPTVWRVHVNHSSNSSLGLFVVTQNSTVSHDRRTKLKTKKQELSLETQKLMVWARKKWKAVTSLIETELASSVTLQVGDDPLANQRCETLSSLPRMYASHVEAQEIRGCIAKWNEDHTEMNVHVIELIQPTVENIGNGSVDVTVDIRSKSRPVKIHHVVLVLKSHIRVRWHVTTRNLRGILDIITDQAVESNGTTTQSFRVAVEQLTAYTGQELINWTCDKYGPPASYTEAHIANRLYLVVDGRGRPLSDQSGSTTEMIPPMGNHGREHSHGNGRPGDGGDALTSEMLDLKMRIIRSLRIECSEDYMMLIVQRAALWYGNLPIQSVSLRNESCVASENRTHYVLYSGTRSCGMSNRTMHDSVALINAIMIKWRSLEESNGNGSLDDDGGNTVSYPIRLSIDVSCDYPIAATLEEVTSSQPLDIQFRLRLFKDAAYRDDVRKFPAVFEESQNVFIQANITADICIQIKVQSCSLEMDNTTATRSRSLIVNGCIVDKSVQWVQPDGEGSRQSRNFLMHLPKIGDRNYKMNFHCKLTVCSVCQGSVVPSIPLCRSHENQCVDQTTAMRDKRLVVSVSSGPLVLAPHSNPDHTSSGLTENTDASGIHQVESTQRHGCDQVVHVEGLSMEIVIAIAFVAFIIGILLMASLWYIYVHTGPGNMKNKSGLTSASNSGDSTPSSTAPITIHR